MRTPQVYYLAPDYDAPSWGVGLLYHHVRILRELGFEAFVVHKRAPFRLRWLDLDVPIRYLDSGGFQPRPQDLLVVPEVMVHDPTLPAMPCRRIVFVQGSFLILNGAETAIDYRDLGYEEAIAVLPHVRDIVARHCGLTPALVPPFVAPYFFAGESDLSAVRRPQVLLAGKPEYEKAVPLQLGENLGVPKRHDFIEPHQRRGIILAGQEADNRIVHAQCMVVRHHE